MRRIFFSSSACEAVSSPGGEEKRGHSAFPDILAWERRSQEARRPAEAWPQELIEAVREFLRTFHLAEPVRVAMGGARTTGSPHLPIDVFAMFDGEYVQPLRADAAVKNTIGPDSVGPNLILLKVALQWFAIKGVLSEMTERFFHSFSRGVVTILEVFDRLRCETDLSHCSSPKTSLKK